MRSLPIIIALFISMAVLAQNSPRPVVSSSDRVDGPFGGEYHVEDLLVFADGRVMYVEEGTDASGRKLPRSAHEGTIGSDELRQLVTLLDSDEVRSLPSMVPSKTRSADFFWHKSLEINRAERKQTIQIENFYPFLNMYHSVYPKALIELGCSLENLKSKIARRAEDKDQWCRALRASTVQTKGHCRQNPGQPAIIAGYGWGPVRIGAGEKVVDTFLGRGYLARGYSDVHFKNYTKKGIQVSFENTSNKVRAIFFYNGQRHSQEFETFCGKTDKGVTWESSVEEVKKAYGNPSAEYSGGDWQRLVFNGIDFRFENDKLVRIGIPAK